jgi:hypothetical protein
MVMKVWWGGGPLTALQKAYCRMIGDGANGLGDLSVTVVVSPDVLMPMNIG